MLECGMKSTSCKRPYLQTYEWILFGTLEGPGLTK